MVKKEVESFLIEKQGYLKKAPIETAKAIWKKSPKYSLPKTKVELEKELELIRKVQIDFRKAKSLQKETEDNKLVDLYNEILEEKNKPKRKLFFDIETSPNIVTSWRVGYNIDISYESIIKERAVICIAYKWSDSDNIKCLSWNNGDDESILRAFVKVVEKADEVITHNGDRFDIKWLRTRCLHHGIPFPNKLNSIDTLKFARSNFYLNSNRLDYIGRYTNSGEKIKTPSNLWTKVVLENDETALQEMVDYCIQDVLLLEEVYNKLQNYVPIKKFKYKLK